MKAFLIFLMAPFTLCIDNDSTELNFRNNNGIPNEVKNTQHVVSIRNKMLEKLYFGLGHICDGSLISTSVVLTAAHCLPSNKSFYYEVVIGTLWQNVSDEYTLVSDVDGIVIHPNYNQTKVSHDIALMFLVNIVPENHFIELTNFDMPENTLCQVSGWGVVEKNVLSDNLLTVDARIIDVRKCNQSYVGMLSEGVICAECITNGALVCGGFLTGFMSCGDECGKKNKSAIYTDVSFFRHWIEGEVAKRNLNNRISTCGGSVNYTPIVHLIIFLAILFCIVFMCNLIPDGKCRSKGYKNDVNSDFRNINVDNRPFKEGYSPSDYCYCEDGSLFDRLVRTNS